MAKYNDVMDNVEMSEEMQQRILRNINEHFEQQEETVQDVQKVQKKPEKTGTKIVRILAPVMASAAVLLLVVISGNLRGFGSKSMPYTADTAVTSTSAPLPTRASVIINGNSDTEEDTDNSTGKGDVNDTGLLTELEAEAGFSCEEIYELALENYIIQTGFADGLAKVECETEENHLIFTKTAASKEAMANAEAAEPAAEIGTASGETSGNPEKNIVENKTIYINEMPIQVTLSGGTIKYAIWEKNGYICTLWAENGITEDELKMIE